MNIICNICRQQFFITTKAPQFVFSGPFSFLVASTTSTDGQRGRQTRGTQSEQAQQTDGRLLPQLWKGIVSSVTPFAATHPPFRGFFGSVQEGLKGEKPARRSLGLATRRVASAGGGTSRPEGFCSFSVFSGRRRRRRRRRCCNGVFYHLPILSHIFFHTSLHHVRRVEARPAEMNGESSKRREARRHRRGSSLRLAHA